MTISRDWVRAMLALWGRWAAGGGAKGLPTVTAFYRPCVPSSGDRWAPPDIEDIEFLICIADKEDRQVLTEQFTRRGTQEQKARHIGISLSQYKRRLIRAENWVGLMLDSRPAIVDRLAG